MFVSLERAMAPKAAPTKVTRVKQCGTQESD